MTESARVRLKTELMTSEFYLLTAKNQTKNQRIKNKNESLKNPIVIGPSHQTQKQDCGTSFLGPSLSLTFQIVPFLCLRLPIDVMIEALCFRLDVRECMRACMCLEKFVSTTSYKTMDGISPNFG